MPRAPIHDPAKEFEKLFRGFLPNHSPSTVFADFCALAALSLANAIIKDQERERRYMEIVGRYNREEANAYAHMLALVVTALDCETPPDFLGNMFHRLELHNRWKGQFFTPMNLCRMMAEMTLGDKVGEIIEERGFITVQEPAVGAGAMIVAMATAMRQRGINYQQHMHVTAIDVDPVAAHMAFIQLSLLHVPAEVYIGNTLSLEMRECYQTPAHHLGFWNAKLSRHWGVEQQPEAAATPPVQTDVIIKNGQYQLFDLAAD
jgi:N-6 DNA Methylase